MSPFVRQVLPGTAWSPVLGRTDGSRLHRQSGVLGRERTRSPEGRRELLQSADIP